MFHCHTVKLELNWSVTIKLVEISRMSYSGGGNNSKNNKNHNSK
jgi:hypothetical protein